MTNSSARKCFVALASILVSFGLTARAEQVIFTEVHYNPPTGEPEFIEVTNNTSTIFDYALWKFTDGVDYTFPDFNPGDPDALLLRPFERILISDVDEATLRAAYSIPASTKIYGPYVGALSNAGEILTLTDKNGTDMAILEYNDAGKWPVAPDGSGHTLVRINPNLAEGEWRNWRSSDSPGGTPGTAPLGEGELPTTETLVTSTTSVWRYDQNAANNDLGSAWREPAFDDTAWPEGPGVFGKDGTDRGFQTPWTTGGRVTYYLRREFEWTSSFSEASIDIEGLVDDGAVIYLNGQELGRYNMPGGAIAFDTPAASREEANSTEQLVTNADITANLQVGTNVLAVEVHNETTGSSDIVFGMDATITAAGLPPGALPKVVISEVHFGNDGRVDWVELYTPEPSGVSVDGYSISSLNDLSDATALSGTISGGGYASFDVDFPLEENGNLRLLVSQGTTVLEARKFDRDLGEETFQSFPAGSGEFYGGTGHTRDSANNPASRNTDIVINEIMYDTPSDHVNGEFVELYNRGSSAVDIGGWRFTDGISFSFPSGTTIAPGGYLVVGADTACLTDAYGAIPMVGNWGGRLSDGGELLRLEDAAGNLADEVDYKPEGDWPHLADGDGSSMELRHPDMDNNVATAWADSDESNKSTMQTFSYTADFERASWSPLSGPQELHAHLVGDAHLIMRNFSLRQNAAGANKINNPGVMSGDNRSSEGWVTQGTHWASYMDNGDLHLISTGHGDNKANRGEVDIDALSFDQSYTLTFEGRWVSGKSRVILQTLDHGFGTSILLPIPENLGTPGAANSQQLTGPAPVVSDVIHSPAVPGPTTPVKVSARVSSAGPLASVELVHRLDSSSGNNPWLRTTMTDDGTGVFSATITQYNSQGNIVQFYVDAKSGGRSTFQPKLGPDRPAMWIADNRAMPDSLLQQRWIISEYDRGSLTVSTGHSPARSYNFPRMSNNFFNCTYIANESEIYYNAEIRKSGSPFTRASNANIDHGKWKLPGDRLFRGRRRSVIDASGTSEGSGTPRFYDDRIARYFMYQLGHPINEMEFFHAAVNGLPFKVREDHEPISNDFLNRHFTDGSDGTLLRIDDEWRFTSDDGDSRSSRNADWSYKDSNNAVRYHSEWLLRTRESDYDFSTFIEWVRTLDENNFDEDEIRRLGNVDMLCLNAAVRGYDADWDTITVNRGKNAYFYLPKENGTYGKGWMLMHWDGDRVFDRAGQAILGGRTGVRTFFDKPYIKRVMNYYMTKLLDEHTRDSARTQAWMQAESDAVAGTGVTMTTSHYTNWFSSRENLARSWVGSAENSETFEITTGSGATANDVLNLAGTASPDIYAVNIPGQGQATFEWLDTRNWRLNGILLQNGANSLSVEGIDHDGTVVANLTFNITKTNNAPPVVIIDSSPKSGNINLGQALELDASGSFDPEGGALTFAWSVSPTAGVNLVPNGAMATATFTVPGIYEFTATATDDQSRSAASVAGAAVYGPGGFSNFGSEVLDPIWSTSNISKINNAPGGPTYSLSDHRTRLTIHVPLPTQTAPNSPVMYIDWGATWKYSDEGEDLTGSFAQPAFDDSAWPSATAFIGYGGINGDIPTPPGYTNNFLARSSTFPGDNLAYYFRHEFNFSGETIGSQIAIDQVVDDGVVYYLNGQEIGRVRIPAGAFDATTEATGVSGEGDPEEGAVIASITGALVEGTNVLAAQVHNSSKGNSDLVFGARVSIAEGNGVPTTDDAAPSWVHRVLPTDGDWAMQTEVKLEHAQFGDFLAGLLVEAIEGGSSIKYGVAFDGGDSISAIRSVGSGPPSAVDSIPAVAMDSVELRIQRSGNQLQFLWHNGNAFTQFHQLSLPAGTTFNVGGPFVSTSDEEQMVTASFDYAMLVDPDPRSDSDLIVSEIMYNPSGGSGDEFLELYNAGATAIELAGYSLIQDEPVAAFTLPAFTLQPGAYALLVADQPAFLDEYGAGLAGQIVAAWPDQSLGNGGDLITITDADGALVTSFTYDDEAPWPIEADGDGPSLEINDPNGDLDPNLASSWHASALSGGTPGGDGGQGGSAFLDWMAANGFNDPSAEYEGTGLSNLLAYAFGRDLTNGSVAPEVDLSSGSVELTYQQRSGDDSLLFAVEESNDLNQWRPAAGFTEPNAPVPNGDGTEQVTLVADIPASGDDTYYRIRVLVAVP